MDIEELKIIAGLAFKLTELRQRECGHLCIENFTPKLFEKLLASYLKGNQMIEGVPFEEDK
jgi:hypothetical protein